MPAMPPMDATMGMSTASATTFSIVPWNRLMTPEAMKAVSRLMPSQTARRGAERNTGAKVSSSSSRPAMDMKEWSASSRMTSTTSSMVILPSSRPSLSTTGADTQSLRSNSLATSESGISTGMGSTSVAIISRTEAEGSDTSRVRSGNRPINWSARFTTIRLSVISGISSWRRR